MTKQDKELVAEKKARAEDIEMIRDLPVFIPRTDICEKPDSIWVVCDMPGVEQKSVDVQLEDDELTITGCQDVREPAGDSLLYRGYTSGLFRRTFTVTTDIRRDGIKARLSKGVLEVVLPKAEKVQPHKIAISAE